MKTLLALFASIILAAAAFGAEPSFDAAATSLPAKFAGSDFERVFAAFTSAGPRGEFETTAEYEARKAAALPAGQYAFVLPMLVPPQYDADREIFTVTAVPGFPSIDGEMDLTYPAFVMKFQNVDASTYEASNALGVKVTVSSREVVEYFLVSRRESETASILTVPVKVPRAEAPALKSRLRLLIVTHLDGTSVLPPAKGIPALHKGATGRSDHAPTLSEPKEVTTYEYALAGDLLGVWAFDEETGRVLGKFDSAGKPLVETTATPRGGE